MSDRVVEWAELGERWREVKRPVSLDTLKRRIAGERRRALLWLAADVTVSVASVAVVAWALWRYPGAWSWTLAADVGVILIAGWAFTLWNDRGASRPLGETTENYLAFVRLRCKRRLLAVRFGWVLLFAQLVIVASWAAFGPRGGPLTAVGAALGIALPALTVAGFAIALSIARRRALREMTELSEYGTD